MLHDEGCFRRAGEDRCWCALRDQQAPGAAIVAVLVVACLAVALAALLFASSGCGRGPRRCQQADAIAWKGDGSDRCTEVR